jgi:transposase
MRETITMTSNEQRRAWLLTQLAIGELTVAEVAVLMSLSVRQVWRLRAAFEREGPAALVHGNRGRMSPRRIADEVRRRVVRLARERYGGINDSHLTELLAEAEGIALSRVSVRRILRAAGLASPRKRRPPRHRSRRERMPQAGLLLQIDGSRHDWLEGRGPMLTLIGGIDDATGIVPAATFRDQEDAAGYFTVLRDTVRRQGIPGAVYRDRHTIFESADKGALTLEEQLADRRTPTQFGRALEELGIGSIAARSPQAKGRIERLWGTFQDRLVAEMRLAGAVDRDAANRVLARFLPRFNRRFAVPPANPAPAWRALPAGMMLERVCSMRFRRTVANDGTIRVGPTVLQLASRAKGRGYAGRRLEVQLRLDGRLAVWDGERELHVTAAPPDASELRRLEQATSELGHHAPSAASTSHPPPADHPWGRVRPGSKLYRRLERERLTESVTS